MSGSEDATAQPDSSAGQNIGPYRVLAPLGAGGMGVVLRAYDSKLHRDVALKVLPASFQLDADRLARFEREAQALAALNHPHIAAIYGFEESSGRQALVLELVEGDTLADRIARAAVPLTETLTIARQIAEALQAAHAKGIVHRDLKPANVKVTPAGVVKVLDFGLAKMGASELPSIATSQAATMVEAGSTRVGAILGTAPYMSPEQARGLTVDARTDIWAFGCVLFEMLSGRKAFAAADASGSIARVLGDEPDWDLLPRTTRARVRGFLRQCLEKDPARRLKTAGEALTVVEQLLAPPTLSRRWQLGITATAILAVSAGAYIWLRLDRQPIANRSDWVQLTKLDSATQPALSPDGRMLAFIRGPGTFITPGQLYVKLLPDGEAVALTHDPMPKMGPAFSPDGSRIAYTVSEGDSWDTWEVPALRGEPRLWLKNASGLTWVDANALLFSEVKSGIHMGVVAGSENRTDVRDVYLPEHESSMAHRSYVSPDHRSVIVVEMDALSRWVPCRLISMADRSSRPVGPAAAECTSAAWTSDGRWMYVSANRGDGFHIWRQRFPDGEPQQITSGPTEEEGIALTRDGQALITSVGLTERGVWLHDATGERQISLEGFAYWPLLSGDGRRLCFRVAHAVATGQGPSELWVADVDSGAAQRLFPGQLVTGYDLSGNDRVVAAVMEPDGRTHVWLSWLDRREPAKRIPQAEGDNPRFTPTGEIVFRVLVGNSGVLYRIRPDGSGREQIARVGGSVFGTISPDGEWLTGTDVEQNHTVAYSMTGRPSVLVLPSSQSSRLRWSQDGAHVYLSVQYGSANAFGTGRTYVLPRANGSALPPAPTTGFITEADIAAVPGTQVLPYGDVAPGPDPSIYAFSRVTTTRNLYRIPLR